MKRRDWLIIGGVAAVVLIIFAVSRLMPAAPSVADDAPLLTAEATASPAPMATDLPAVTDAPATTAAPTAEATEAASIKAYLLVTVGDTVYQPIPLTKETTYTVHQDATDATNVIHVTADSIWMESSTCEGQDCVKQGAVSLSNKGSRILGSMVICLPNQVTLELLTPAEVREMLTGANAQ